MTSERFHHILVGKVQPFVNDDGWPYKQRPQNWTKPLRYAPGSGRLGVCSLFEPFPSPIPHNIFADAVLRKVPITIPAATTYVACNHADLYSHKLAGVCAKRHLRPSTLPCRHSGDTGTTTTFSGCGLNSWHRTRRSACYLIGGLRQSSPHPTCSLQAA